MSRKRESMIVVLCTLACVFVLIYNDFATRTDLNDNYDLEQRTEEKKMEANKEGDKKTEGYAFHITERSLEMKFQQIQQMMEEDRNICGESSQKEKEKPKETKKEDKPTSTEKKDGSVEGKGGSQVASNDVQGMKDVQVVWNQVSSEDKAKLMKAAKKLSAFDYVKVKESMEKNDSQSIAEVLQLLRDRLSESDFKEISDIWNKYSALKSEKK